MLRYFQLNFYKRRLFAKMEFMLKFRCQSHHVGAIAYPAENFKIDQLFRKILSMTHRQKVCPYFDKRKHFECDSVFPIKLIQQLSSDEAFIDSKAEIFKNDIFRQFLPIFRYFCGTPLKIHHYIAYFKKLSIDIFIKKFFSDD